MHREAMQLNTKTFPLVVDTYNQVVANEAKNLTDMPNFWVHLVVAGYQPLPSADHDPTLEPQRHGETAGSLACGYGLNDAAASRNQNARSSR
jgi:hypothetical protein